MQLTLPFRTKISLSASDETAELYIHNFCWFQPQALNINKLQRLKRTA